MRIEKETNRQVLLTCLFWIGFSLVVTGIFLFYGRILFAADGSFHFSRVEEIYQNLRTGHFFTYIAAHTFNSSGVGNFLFYPTVFLFPWALLRFIFSPVISFYLWLTLFFAVTFIIAYYSMLGFSKNRLRSLTFALIYGLANYHLYLGLSSLVLGEFIAYSFIPMIFYGFYSILFTENKHWIILALGMTFLAYSHWLSVFLATLVLATGLILDWLITRKFSKVIVFDLLKSIGLVFLLCGFELVPFLTDYLGQDILSPQPGFLLISTPKQVFMHSLTNWIQNSSIGFILLITVLIGWYFVRKNKTEIWIYAFGVFGLFATTTLFPWALIAKIPLISKLQVIQFPYRLNVFISLFLAMTASYILQKLIMSSKNHHYQMGLLVAIFGLSLVNYYVTIYPTLTVDRAINPGAYLKPNKVPGTLIPLVCQIDNQNYHNIFGYRIIFGETDYYTRQKPQKNGIDFVPTILSHQVMENGQPQILKPKLCANKISYTLNLKQSSDVDLPVVRYHRTQLQLDNKLVPSTRSVRGTVETHVTAGKHQLTVTYKPSLMMYLGELIAVITWAILGVRWRRKMR